MVQVLKHQVNFSGITMKPKIVADDHEENSNPFHKEKCHVSDRTSLFSNQSSSWTFKRKLWQPP